MRRKISKRKKKELRKLGCLIYNEHFITEPGWKRKQSGFGATVEFRGWKIDCCGHDELKCFNIALEFVKEEIECPTITANPPG